jgi:hypothetical protein
VTSFQDVRNLISVTDLSSTIRNPSSFRDPSSYTHVALCWYVRPNETLRLKSSEYHIRMLPWSQLKPITAASFRVGFLTRMTERAEAAAELGG